MKTYLAWPIALQFKHVHRVVDPPTEVIKLNIPSQTLDAHLEINKKVWVPFSMRKTTGHYLKQAAVTAVFLLCVYFF